MHARRGSPSDGRSERETLDGEPVAEDVADGGRRSLTVLYFARSDELSIPMVRTNPVKQTGVCVLASEDLLG